ncbi:hypothetical protein GC722_06390 [Auraticoccus sp. F435]|uniref:Uncharacterized protein n=1 Tax=Auraticoccus cholistanensis TaxID=2656650 RepID=A0A6A9US74_9ACTN|nr:hypothetical protein [Auraticoccus cholistanensis]MVA75653.1 hypothetical protein [Auraticoccus cholistanensis]
MPIVPTSSRRLTGGLAALVLGLGLTLSGCGGSSEETASPDAPAASEQAPSASGSPSAGESPSAGGETSSSEEQGGDKPSREEVAAGLTAAIGEFAPGMGELSKAVLDQLSSCAVDKIYDSASADSLQAFADGELASADADDLTALSEAISTCGNEITPG